MWKGRGGGREWWCGDVLTVDGNKAVTVDQILPLLRNMVTAVSIYHGRGPYCVEGERGGEEGGTGGVMMGRL